MGDEGCWRGPYFHELVPSEWENETKLPFTGEVEIGGEARAGVLTQWRLGWRGGVHGQTGDQIIDVGGRDGCASVGLLRECAKVTRGPICISEK